MGLGLSIADAIIKKHNGYINIQSVLNRGTDVYIYLPASEKQIIQDKPTVKSSNGKLKRILFMDDEEAIRNMVKTILNKFGYEVELASNGLEAIDHYKKALDSSKRFGLVILDLTINGGMGGVETIKQLIKLDPMVNAIIISGYSGDPIMSDYRKYGFISALRKPVSMSELKETIENIFTEGRRVTEK